MTTGDIRARRPAEGPQILALTKTFLARFFENDLTDGHRGVRTAFFSLLAILSGTWFLMPQPRGGWEIVAARLGPEGGAAFLQMVSGVGKVAAIGISMAGIGGIAAIVWSALLVDRRDILVLGGFPLRPRTMLAGKAAALTAFLGVSCLGMHGLASVYYGVMLGAGNTVNAFRIMSAHFVAVSAAGLFVYAAIIAAQGVLLAAAGPRVFDRLTPVLQVLLVAGVIALLMLLPRTADATVGTVYHIGSKRAPWVLWMPQVWFLGLYDTLQGTPLPMPHMLAARALVATGGAAALAALMYPLAFRRVALAALVEPPATARRSGLQWTMARLPAILADDPVGQATVQFTLSTIGRVTLHRLVLAAALGLAVAIGLPFVAGALGPHLPGRPIPALYVPPILLMFWVLTGLRLAISLPAERRAAWLFAAAAGPSWAAHRHATRRLFWLFGVAPALLLSLPLVGYVAGIPAMMRHLVVLLAIGTLFVEIVMTDADGMPFTRPFSPETALMRSRGPWYFMCFLVLLLPVIESSVIGRTMGSAIFSLVLVLAGLLARVRAEGNLPPAGISLEAFEEAARFDLR